MKKTPIYIFLVLLVALTGCKDDITVDGIGDTQKLVVYCFPSPSLDTTYIYVTKSLPVKQYKDNVKLETVDDARISYTVNGVQQTVEYRGGGYCYVTTQHHTGDNIQISVNEEGMPAATAETTIPDTVGISSIAVREINLYDDDYGRSIDYDQYTATFTDPISTKDYYAVRVGEWRDEDYYTWGNDTVIDQYGNQQIIKVHVGDSVVTVPYYRNINTQSEPLLKPMTSVDKFFGFDNYFYGGLAIFDDDDLNGSPYTLHLNIDHQRRYNQLRWVELLHLSPEYYNFLKSINAIENNDLAKYGLSQIMPTASNVNGGLGVVGGWNMSKTEAIHVR